MNDASKPTYKVTLFNQGPQIEIVKNEVNSEGDLELTIRSIEVDAKGSGKGLGFRPAAVGGRDGRGDLIDKSLEDEIRRIVRDEYSSGQTRKNRINLVGDSMGNVKPA